MLDASAYASSARKDKSIAQPPTGGNRVTMAWTPHDLVVTSL